MHSSSYLLRYEQCSYGCIQVCFLWALSAPNFFFNRWGSFGGPQRQHLITRLPFVLYFSIRILIAGHVPFGILVKNPNTTLSDEEILTSVYKSVRELVGPVAALSKACLVPKLPKTRSGKISRGSLAEMASGKPVRVSLCHGWTWATAWYVFAVGVEVSMLIITVVLLMLVAVVSLMVVVIVVVLKKVAGVVQSPLC